jgi:hypothetical protein
MLWRTGKYAFGNRGYPFQQGLVPGQVGYAELQHAGLSRAEHFSRTSQFKVFLGNPEPVRGLAHDSQPLPGQGPGRWISQQDTGSLFGSASDPAAQLVQLCQPQPFRIFNDHQ